MKHSSFYNDKVPRNLSKYEKRAIGIVVTGNFLEYFDLMLFTHLAFVVTPYFTPKSDPTVAKLLTILAFSSSFIIRPFAAYFWGYIGDHFGRVVVLSYTTFIMGITCFIIPSIPSYEEIGIYSTILILSTRVFQGFSSAGEAKGAEVFIAELVPFFPTIFIASALVPITCDLGGLMATLLGGLCLSFSEEGWKNCFYLGAVIAFCSSISRKKLRETKDFHNSIKQKNKVISPVKHFFEKRNFIALIGLNMICPTAFYFTYGFCSDFLKHKVGLADNLILLNNSALLGIEIFFLLLCARIAYQVDPFKILKVRTFISFLLIPFSFLLLYYFPMHSVVFCTQLIVLLSTASFDPATPIIIRSFNAKTRLSQYSKAWAFSKAFMYLSTGYLTHYLNEWFGLWGVLGILLFFSGIFCVSLYYFVPYYNMMKTYRKLRQKNGLCPVSGKHYKEIFEDKGYKHTQLRKWINQ